MKMGDNKMVGSMGMQVKCRGNVGGISLDI